MKNIFLLFAIVTAISSSLSANDIYIKVMSVKETTYFPQIKSSLQRLGHPIYITQYEDWYRIYTGPFKNTKDAQQVLQTIRRNIAKEAYIQPLEINNGQVIVYPVEKVTHTTRRQSEPQKQIVLTQTNSLRKNKDFFVGLSGGFSKVNISKTNIQGDIPLDVTLKDSGFDWQLEGGYYFNNYSFMTLNYQHTNLEDTDFDKLFGTLNYQFYSTPYTSTYIGAVAGYSMMSWKNPPITSLQQNDRLFSFGGGLQLGNNIPIIDELSFYFFYRLWLMNNKTNVKTNSAEKEIKHENEQNIDFGLKYNF